MTQLTVRAGRAYMVTSPEREAALQDLTKSLDHDNVTADLDITRYIPGRRGLPPPWTPETVAIYIGSGVAGTMIVAVTNDAYAKAKDWALKRYRAKREQAKDLEQDEDRVKGENFIIYGPNQEVLKTWTVDKDGEHETDGD